MSKVFFSFFIAYFVFAKRYIEKNDEIQIDHNIPIEDKEFLEYFKHNHHKCLKNTKNKSKIDSFKESSCAPIVILPGFLGTKLEFQITDCSEFKKHHLDIMTSCGWSNCSDRAIKKFTLWINFEINIPAIISEMLTQKKPKKTYIPNIISKIEVEEMDFKYEIPNKKNCFGNLMRLYYINDKIDYELASFKGAKVSVKLSTIEECGSDAVSNFAEEFSKERSLQGFYSLNKFLINMGYSHGSSLFNMPYDFRLPISQILPNVEKTVNLAISITNKKPIIIGHSLGGLIAYEFALRNKNLVEEIISIGSPFLGAYNTAENFILQPHFKMNKEIEIMGMKVKLDLHIDDSSMSTFMHSLALLHLYPRNGLGDEIDDMITDILDYKGGDQSKSVEYFFNIFPKYGSECISTSAVVNNPTCKIHKMNYIGNEIQKKDRFGYIFDINSKDFIHQAKKIYNDLKIKGLDENFVEYQLSEFRKNLFSQSYSNPDVPFTFIYSNHLQVIIRDKDKIKHIPGDGTVESISQIYPGLRWIFQKHNRDKIKPVHFVEYCTEYNDQKYEKELTQYLSIGCDCINQTNLISADNCSHSSMINDTKIIMLIGDIINKTNSIKNEYNEKKFSNSLVCSNLFIN